MADYTLKLFFNWNAEPITNNHQLDSKKTYYPLRPELWKGDQLEQPQGKWTFFTKQDDSAKLKVVRESQTDGGFPKSAEFSFVPKEQKEYPSEGGLSSGGSPLDGHVNQSTVDFDLVSDPSSPSGDVWITDKELQGQSSHFDAPTSKQPAGWTFAIYVKIGEDSRGNGAKTFVFDPELFVDTWNKQ